jgi:hypothetical protein
VPTLATADALVARLPVSEGMADAEISDA